MAWYDEPVKAGAKALGADDKTASAASVALDPTSLIRGGKLPKDTINDLKGGLQDLTKTEPTYKVQAPPPIVAPTLDPNAKATVMNLPEAFKGAQIRTVAGPASPDFSQSAAATGYQQGLAADLAAASRGQGPSLAAEQLKQAQAANTAATFSMLASQRGGPTASGSRTAMQTAADIQAKTAQDAALARIQEQVAAREGLGQVTSNMRAGDVAEVGMKTDVELARFKGDLDTAIAQGKIDQDTASQIYASKVDQAKQNALFQSEYNSRVDKYVAMGLDVATANQRAELEVQRIRAAVPQTKSALDQGLGVISQVAGPATTLMTGNPAAGAAVTGAAASLRPPPAQYTGATAEPEQGIVSNQYRDNTSYRTQ